MSNATFKIGDKVRIINCRSIEPYELNEIGTIVDIQDYDTGSLTYVVDMGRPRRARDPKLTCWYLRYSAIELVSKPNEQLVFDFMNE